MRDTTDNSALPYGALCMGEKVKFWEVRLLTVCQMVPSKVNIPTLQVTCGLFFLVYWPCNAGLLLLNFKLSSSPSSRIAQSLPGRSRQSSGDTQIIDAPPISCKNAALSYLLDEASESGPVNLVEVLLGNSKRHPTATIELE